MENKKITKEVVKKYNFLLYFKNRSSNIQDIYIYR